MQVARKVIKENFRLDYPEDVPGEIRELLSSCMARDPRDRPTFSDIVSEMDEGGDGGEVIYASLSTFADVDGATGDLGAIRDSNF